ncbi:unnamed protein product [Paramecium sonneborni]|uniref:Uncharacterized protein n=1 Tax=Paramecium sonneborni TaxID=65129 RepID=A0A8S1R7N3_9CILI|nr:unnamed protein product [Paramecium sonneborni]
MRINYVKAICQKLKEFKAEQIKIAIKEMRFNCINFLIELIKITLFYKVRIRKDRIQRIAFWLHHQIIQKGVMRKINQKLKE